MYNILWFDDCGQPVSYIEGVKIAYVPMLGGTEVVQAMDDFIKALQDHEVSVTGLEVSPAAFGWWILVEGVWHKLYYDDIKALYTAANFPRRMPNIKPRPYIEW